MANCLSCQRSLPCLIGLEILQYEFEEFLDNKPLFLVEGLDLWDLLVLLEVLGELIEGGEEVGDHIVFLMFAGVTQLLEGVDHHDELLECVDTECQVLLGNVKRLQVLTHIVHDLLALLRLLLYYPYLTDYLS